MITKMLKSRRTRLFTATYLIKIRASTYPSSTTKDFTNGQECRLILFLYLNIGCPMILLVLRRLNAYQPCLQKTIIAATLKRYLHYHNSKIYYNQIKTE